MTLSGKALVSRKEIFMRIKRLESYLNILKEIDTLACEKNIPDNEFEHLEEIKFILLATLNDGGLEISETEYKAFFENKIKEYDGEDKMLEADIASNKINGSDLQLAEEPDIEESSIEDEEIQLEISDKPIGRLEDRKTQIFETQESSEGNAGQGTTDFEQKIVERLIKNPIIKTESNRDSIEQERISNQTISQYDTNTKSESSDKLKRPEREEIRTADFDRASVKLNFKGGKTFRMFICPIYFNDPVDREYLIFLAEIGKGINILGTTNGIATSYQGADEIVITLSQIDSKDVNGRMEYNGESQSFNKQINGSHHIEIENDGIRVHICPATPNSEENGRAQFIYAVTENNKITNVGSWSKNRSFDYKGIRMYVTARISGEAFSGNVTDDPDEI